MDRNELLETMEAFKDAVATFTGVKTQFMDAGWSEHAAELMVHALLAQGTK